MVMIYQCQSYNHGSRSSSELTITLFGVAALSQVPNYSFVTEGNEQFIHGPTSPNCDDNVQHH